MVLKNIENIQLDKVASQVEAALWDETAYLLEAASPFPAASHDEAASQDEATSQYISAL